MRILKIWDKTTDAKVMVHGRKSRAFCWSEYSVAWSYTGGQGHTRVAHWDNSLVIHANHYCLNSVQHNKLLQVLALGCNVHTMHLDGAILPYGIAHWIDIEVAGNIQAQIQGGCEGCTPHFWGSHKFFRHAVCAWRTHTNKQMHQG